ncbi:MAG: DUF1559 domain-containing protein [Planctomyces sp.]
MKYLVSSLSAVAVVLSLAWVVGADKSQNGELPAPETLMPATGCLVFTHDGSNAHLDGLKKTAAWMSLEESGLTARILDLVQLFASANGAENGVLAREFIDHVRSSGLSGSVSVSNSEGQLTPYGILVLHGAGEFMDRLESVIRPEIEKQGEAIEERTLEERSIRVVASNTPGVEVSWWNENGHLVVTFGMQAVEQTLAVASGRSPNVSKNPNWAALRKSDRYTVDCFGWADAEMLLKQFGDLPLPPAPSGKTMSIREALGLVGLDNLKRVTAQSGYHEAQTWIDSRLEADGPLKGLAALLNQRTLSLSELPPLPKGTTGFAAAAFDAAGACDTVLSTIRNVMKEVEPTSEEKLDEALAKVSEIFGGDPRTQLLAGFGDIWCVYADPAPLPIPIGFSPVVAVSVRDKAILSSGIDRLMKIIQQEAGNANFSVRHTKKDGRETWSLNLSGMPFVPTMSLSDKWMAIGAIPGAIQSLNQREAKKLPSWKPDEKISGALSELPKKFSSISMSDPSAGYVQLMQFAPMGLNLLEQQALPNLGDGTLEMPFTAEDLPAVEQITEPLFPNVAVGYSLPNGFASTTRQSIPSSPVGNISSAAVVPILVALLLPAVQQAREAARRTQSKNNLKQLMLAMHNYHDVYNSFPDGTVENADLEPDERLSWGYSILPFLEQGNLYEQLDGKSGWEAESNASGVQLTVPAFVNPSQPGKRPNPSSGDYVGIAGVGENAAMLPKNDPKAGVFGYNRSCRIADITDGTSNTIIITDASEPNASFLAGGRATIRSFSQKPYLNGPDGIGSHHVGIVQMALADGSVRAVSVNIDESVLEALATKAGGEEPSEF